MRNYLWIVLLLSTLLLVACSNETEKESDVVKVQKIELLSDEKIKDIVLNNLDQMDESVREDFDETLVPIDESILEPDKSTKEIEKLVEKTKVKFENLVSSETMDEWVRNYLYTVYISFHIENLRSDNIHSRFEVLNKSEDSFDVSFISLAADDGGVSYSGGTYHLYYVKENDHWVFKNIDFLNAEEKPLNLTFEYLEEYYNKFDEGNSDFEAIEEVEIDGEKYLVFKIDSIYKALSTIDSENNYELAESYNSQNQSSEPVAE